MQINEFDYQSVDALFGDYKERAQKLYLTREGDLYNLRGYMLRLIKQINTTQELIEEAFIKWKLKMN